MENKIDMNCFTLFKCIRRGNVSGLAGNQTHDSCISIVKSSTTKLTWPIPMVHKAPTIKLLPLHYTENNTPQVLTPWQDIHL